MTDIAEDLGELTAELRPRAEKIVVIDDFAGLTAGPLGVRLAGPEAEERPGMQPQPARGCSCCF